MSIFEQPWLCSTIKDEICESTSDTNVSDDETELSTTVNVEGLDLQGLKMVYYPVEHGDKVGYNGHDKIFGEDRLEEIIRSFYFIGSCQSIPPNVRTYKMEGIWGEDVFTIYAAKPAFNYFSTYGGSDRNTPKVYEVREPMIGDIIYLPNNEMFYEVRDVKYWESTLGLTSNTYILTCKVYKDTKITVLADATITADDPIYRVCQSKYNEQNEFNDPLELNDKLSDEGLINGTNENLFDYVWRK